MSVPTWRFACPAGFALCLWLAASAVAAQPEVPIPAVVPPAPPSRIPPPTPRAPVLTQPGRTAPRDALEVEENELEKTRDRRRAAHRAKLEELWGDLIQQPPGLVELRLHGWRMARLRRLARLAALSTKPALAERITRLEAKEEARHVRQLNRLKHPAAPSSAAPHPPRLAPATGRSPATGRPPAKE